MSDRDLSNLLLPGTDLQVSPSAFKQYDCPRAYAFKYLQRAAKLPEDHPLMGARTFGTRMHGQGEAWMRHGTAPDQTTKEGRVFVRTIPLIGVRPGLARVEGIPPGSPAGTLSKPVRVAWDGVTLFGFVDWDYRAARLFGDHKSAGDVSSKKFPILNSRTLPLDPAFLIYSEALLREWPEAHDITGRWTYGCKKESLAPVRVEAVARREPRRLAVLQETLDGIRRLHDTWPSVGDPNLVPNRPAKCDGWGRGCDYGPDGLNLCRIRPDTTIPTTKDPNTMSDPLADLMRELNLAPAAGAPAPPPPAPAPVTPPPAADLDALVKGLEAGQGGAPEAATQAPAVKAEVLGQAAPDVVPPTTAPPAEAKPKQTRTRTAKTDDAPAPGGAVSGAIQGFVIDGTALLRDGKALVVTTRYAVE